MNLQKVEKIANAVLYEGYLLYPYRLSSVKNRKRFQFGVLAPPAYSAAQGGTELSSMRTECLLAGSAACRLEVRVRFLQLPDAPDRGAEWCEAVERTVILPEFRLAGLLEQPRHEDFSFPPVEGSLHVSALQVGDGLFRVAVVVSNTTSVEACSREKALAYSAISTHTIVAAEAGAEFVSLLDPPQEFRAAANDCRNIGTWPVLAGEPGGPSTVLSSPIILYDYAEIAPESPGDLFDGTEIDEILTLRILTMTEEEKREARATGDRGRSIVDRTESLPPEYLARLHGAMRGVRPLDRGAE